MSRLIYFDEEPGLHSFDTHCNLSYWYIMKLGRAFHLLKFRDI